MASNSQGFGSVTGKAETAEPTPTTTAPTQAPPPRDTSPVAKRQTSSASTPAPLLRKQPSSNLTGQAVTSGGTSPRTSRNTSPIRPSARPENTQNTTRTGSRSRKSSNDALSPSRPSILPPPTSTLPSAAAIQRALSATSIPQSQPGPVTEAVSKLPRAPRSAAASGESTPQWPSSPRVKSPPPSVQSRRNSLLKSKTEPITNTPTITVENPTPSTSTAPINGLSADPTIRADQQQTSAKGPSRGPSGPKSSLETVEENSVPSEKSESSSPQQAKASAQSSDEDKRSAQNGKSSEESAEKHTKIGESESEGNKSDEWSRKAAKSVNAPKPKTVPASNKYTPSASAKSRQSEGGTRNMTVETETVASIPQSALNSGAGDRTSVGRSDGGSIRLKPSNETIRPRKERKRPNRKAASINSGTASSKADIFEARVASAVDEANSSDSDETFVYESNPPEPQRPRHHSRTPSATSAHSQADHARGIRGYGAIVDNHRVAGKRSMKFSNNPYNALDSPTDTGNGTVRAHPRHIGRLGRTGGSHASSYNEDSPFTQASKLRNGYAGSGRHSPRPNTPKSGTSRASAPWNRKNDVSQYDFDGEGADDERNERTPLMGSVRTPRSGRQSHRRMNSGSARSIDYYGVHQTSWSSRFGGCLLGTVVVLLIVFGAVGFLIMSNKPLYDVDVEQIQNVSASEQEIMLDLLVGAVNPNVLSVSVTDMDVNVFAKSKHVGSPKFWRDHSLDKVPTEVSKQTPNRRRRRQGQGQPSVQDQLCQDPYGHWRPCNGVDHGTDPIDDDKGDAQTMSLGRIFHFDQGSIFEGSPLKRHQHFSIGEVRSAHPGNKTEMGGSERWERVIMYPFELIVRGVVKYQLPISSREITAAIGATVLVHPEEGVDESGNMRVERVDHSEEWEWVEVEDLGG